MNFPAFQHSVFLQSLGWAIASSIWQGGLLWIFYQVTVTSYNNASAKFKNNLSTALLYGNFLWFVLTFFTKIIHLHNYLPDTRVNQLPDYGIAPTIPGNLFFQNSVSYIAVTFPYLSLAYLLLLLFFGVKLLNSYRNTRFLKSNGLLRPDAAWKTFVDSVTRHISFNKNIKIWFSKYVDVPATIGFFKPVILIPLASLNKLTTEQVEAIILHEISHIKRNDYLLNLFVSLIETILFFNPFVVLLSRAIKKERENCCDDFVLQYQYDRHSYASALLVLEQSREQHFDFALAATSGRQQLLYRIKRIMEAKTKNDGLNYGQKLLALVTGTGIIFSIAWLTPQKKPIQHFSPLPQSLPLKDIRQGAGKEIINQAYLKEKTKNIVPFGRLQVQNNGKDNLEVPESNDATSDEVNATLNDRLNEAESSVQDVDSKDINLQAPVLKQLMEINDDSKSGDSLLSATALLNKLHLNIDLKKLKNDIEKQNHSIASIDWDNISEQVIENLKKSTFPGFDINIENDKINFALARRNYNNNNQKQFKQSLLNPYIDEKKLRIMRLQQEEDSINLFYDENQAGVNNDYDAINNINFPQPPPPADVKVKKPVTVYQFRSIKQPAGSYTFSYHAHNSPKIETVSPPSVSINYKQGTIIINGKTINFPSSKKLRVEKIIKILKMDKTVPEIKTWY